MRLVDNANISLPFQHQETLERMPLCNKISNFVAAQIVKNQRFTASSQNSPKFTAPV
jgi:hypothetical protein